MTTIYSRTFDFETSDSDEIVAVGAPPAGFLSQLVVVSDDNSSFTVDVFSRSLAWSSAQDIGGIERATNGKVQILSANDAYGFPERFSVRAGDPLTTVGTGVVAYDGVQHVVTVSEDRTRIITDVDWVEDVAGSGTIQFEITDTNEQELYRILPQQTGASNLMRFSSEAGVPYQNQDPREHYGSSPLHKIYLRFDQADTYRVSITAWEDL